MIKDCPNCGSSNVKVLQFSTRIGMTDEVYDRANVVCLDCRCHGPKSKCAPGNEQEAIDIAIKLWNNNLDKVASNFNESKEIKRSLRSPRKGRKKK